MNKSIRKKIQQGKLIDDVKLSDGSYFHAGTDVTTIFNCGKKKGFATALQDGIKIHFDVYRNEIRFQ